MCLPSNKCCCFVPALLGLLNNDCCLHHDLHQMHTLLHLIACTSLMPPAQSAGIGGGSSHGYLSLLIALLLLQAKIIQVDFASCQALSDINDLSTAVLQQHDMLSAFKEVAVPKLNTWVVARVTGNNAQPAAMTQTASNSAVTPIHQFPPAAERRASAVAPAPEAAATPSASAEFLETAARSRSAENNRSYTMMQAGAGDPSRAPHDADVDKHAGQVRPVRPLVVS